MGAIVSCQNKQYTLEETVKAGTNNVVLKKNHDWNTEILGKTQDFHGIIESSLRNLKKDSGLCDFGKLLSTVPRFINAVAERTDVGRFAPLDACAKEFDSSWKGLLTIPRAIVMMPGVMKDVKQATSTGSDLREKVTGISSAADATTMWALTAGMLAGFAAGTKRFAAHCFKIADVSNLVQYGTSFGLNVEKLRVINKLDLSTSGDALKEVVSQTKKNTFLATVKDVVGIASGIFAVLLLVMGAPIVPVIVLATLSVASAILGAAQHLYEETMVYKPINPYKDIAAVII